MLGLSIELETTYIMRKNFKILFAHEDVLDAVEQAIIYQLCYISESACVYQCSVRCFVLVLV